jgi:hypothetical protein
VIINCRKSLMLIDENGSVVEFDDDVLDVELESEVLPPMGLVLMANLSLLTTRMPPLRVY